MRFARVYGFVTSPSNAGRWLTVLLDTGKDVRTVRDEAVAAGLAAEDPEWLVDQLVQETLGNELATDGWEVVGESSVDESNLTGPGAIATSPVWLVRRV